MQQDVPNLPCLRFGPAGGQPGKKPGSLFVAGKLFLLACLQVGSALVKEVQLLVQEVAFRSCPCLAIQRFQFETRGGGQGLQSGCKNLPQQGRTRFIVELSGIFLG